AASRDYLGPFSVDGNGAALFVRLRVAGAPLDYVVVDKGTGDLWRQSYEAGQPIGPPPMQPISYGTAPIGDSQRAVP
ncbi:hypothetical protein LWS67_25935, partial [Bacillus atrophaeus]|uniref:hypothetical protein n=1 Tax=Bacillus atrophaeus TaxID=1452 RepID=UPI001EFADF2B